MKAQNKRHINPTSKYDHLLPTSVGRDTVIVGAGKAKLEDTLELMQQVIVETLNDTKLLAEKFKSNSTFDTCKKIWDFVYRHIQYTMDKTGIEQVRRPSRTWADRIKGVDCDCYTVFIGSILTNLGIPFKMRITKYGGKHHFQHVYPIVPTTNGHITLDCVTDRFNYEVRFSEKQDIVLTNKIKNLNGFGILSGVDIADISLNALSASPIPLREVIPDKEIKTTCTTPIANPKDRMAHKSGHVLSPFRLDDNTSIKTISTNKEFNLLNFLILSGISVAAGIGVLQLLSRKVKNKNSKKTLTTKRKKNIKRSQTR